MEGGRGVAGFLGLESRRGQRSAVRRWRRAATSQRAEKGQLCLTNIPRFEGPEISSPFLPRWDLPRMSRRQGNLQNFIYPPDHPSSMLLFRDSLLFPSYPESSVLFRNSYKSSSRFFSSFERLLLLNFLYWITHCMTEQR